MTDEFVGVVTDTTALWLCGTSYIPRIGESLGIAGSKLAGTAAHDGAFEHSVNNAHGVYDTVGATGATFILLRDELQNIISASVTNIFGGGAVVWTRSYAASVNSSLVSYSVGVR